MAEDKIDNWHGKPIGELSRGELIDALDWCVKELRVIREQLDLVEPRKVPQRAFRGIG